MTRNGYAATGALAGLLLLALPVFAHHAATAEFDVYQPVTVKGTITKVDWFNPHIYIYMEVKDDSGKVSTWDFETTNPGRLHAAGLSRNVVGLGKVVTMYGYMAKDKTKNFAWMRKITFDDGHTVEIWPDNATDLKEQR